MILLDMQNFIYGVLMVKGKSYCSAKWIKWAFSFAFKTIINQDSIDAERSHPSSSLNLAIYAALSQDCFTLLCKLLVERELCQETNWFDHRKCIK